MKSTRNSFNNN